MRKGTTALVLLLFFAIKLNAQQPGLQGFVNVERYVVTLDLSDFSKRIEGKAQIDFEVAQLTKVVKFELVNSQNNGKTGMVISAIKMAEKINWIHVNDTIVITSSEAFSPNNKYSLLINYKGYPEDGLIISKNKHGKPTAFGDNWPNRAHHWFPCVDHPSDKAFIEWKVTYPSSMRLVANGNLIADSTISKSASYNHWQSTVPLPTKVMVIGLADFAVSEPCMVNDVEVTSWIFNEQKEEGFADYAIACEVLDWFENKIAEYPFAKLANVQSKTRYGGMENASCIFYYENSVNGKGQVEDLIAHEIAHQWFGNSASESDWPHLWLSEGFATYLTDIYIEEKYGIKAFKGRLIGERNTALNFYNSYKAPVVDTLATDPKHLLNPNSYQKGAWFLHMLRVELGDNLFWTTLVTYYNKHHLANASTNDFLNVLNEVSGKDYSDFVDQWLKTTGHPQLKVKSRVNRKNELVITIEQKQEKLFDFNLDLEVYTEKQQHMLTENIDKRRTKITYELNADYKGLEIDPNVKLFFELIE